MLRIGFGCLSLAVLLGLWLAMRHLQPEARRPSWISRAAHGLCGAGGLALLLGAAPLPEDGFGRAGLTGIAMALPLGLVFWLGWNRLGRAWARNGVLILHASAAITGYVLLSEWYLNR